MVRSKFEGILSSNYFSERPPIPVWLRVACTWARSARRATICVDDVYNTASLLLPHAFAVMAPPRRLHIDAGENLGDDGDFDQRMDEERRRLAMQVEHSGVLKSIKSKYLFSCF